MCKYRVGLCALSVLWTGSCHRNEKGFPCGAVPASRCFYNEEIGSSLLSHSQTFYVFASQKIAEGVFVMVNALGKGVADAHASRRSHSEKPPTRVGCAA